MKNILSLAGILSISVSVLQASSVAHPSASDQNKKKECEHCSYDLSAKRTPALDNMLDSSNHSCSYAVDLNLDYLSFQKSGNAFGCFGAYGLTSIIAPPKGGTVNFDHSFQPGFSGSFQIMDRHTNSGLELTFEFIDINYQTEEATGGTRALMSTYPTDPSDHGNVELELAQASFQPRHLGVLFYFRKASIQYSNLAINAAAGMGYENNSYTQEINYFESFNDKQTLVAKEDQNFFAGSVKVDATYRPGCSQRFALIASAEFRPLLGLNRGKFTNSVQSENDDPLYFYNISTKNLELNTAQKAALGFNYFFTSAVRNHSFGGKLSFSYVAEFRPAAFNAASPVGGSNAKENIYVAGLRTGATLIF